MSALITCSGCSLNTYHLFHCSINITDCSLQDSSLVVPNPGLLYIANTTWKDATNITLLDVKAMSQVIIQDSEMMVGKITETRNYIKIQNTGSVNLENISAGNLVITVYGPHGVLNIKDFLFLDSSLVFNQIDSVQISGSTLKNATNISPLEFKQVTSVILKDCEITDTKLESNNYKSVVNIANVGSLTMENTMVKNTTILTIRTSSHNDQSALMKIIDSKMTNMTSMHLDSVTLIGSNSSFDAATIMIQNSELFIEKSSFKNIAGCTILTARESRLVISDSLFLAKVNPLSRPLIQEAYPN